MPVLSIRSLLRRIAALSSIHPIEVILLTFIIVTLTYFQLLHTIKHSDLCVSLSLGCPSYAIALEP